MHRRSTPCAWSAQVAVPPRSRKATAEATRQSVPNRRPPRSVATNPKAGGTASANRASRPVPETSPPPPVEKLDPATRRVSLKAPSEASSAAAAREAAREAAPEPTKHAAELAGGRSTDGLAAQWLQGAAEAATRWLRPGEHLDGASARLAALETGSDRGRARRAPSPTPCCHLPPCEVATRQWRTPVQMRKHGEEEDVAARRGPALRKKCHDTVRRGKLGRRAPAPIARARRRVECGGKPDAAATDSGGGLTAEEDDRLL